MLQPGSIACIIPLKGRKDNEYNEYPLGYGKKGSDYDTHHATGITVGSPASGEQRIHTQAMQSLITEGPGENRVLTIMTCCMPGG